jgi:hypothetical protein
VKNILRSITNENNKVDISSKEYKATKKIIEKTTSDTIDESVYGKPLKPYVIDCTFSI